MASDFKLKKASSAAITITLASLATDTNLLAGRQSDAVSNLSNLYLDYIVGGKITVGTTPTTATGIEVWVYAAVNDTPLYSDTFTGTDGNLSVTSRSILASAAFQVQTIILDSTTSNRTYWLKPVSLAALCGQCPLAFGLWVVHNTAVNLHATGSNHALYYTPIYAQSI